MLQHTDATLPISTAVVASLAFVFCGQKLWGFFTSRDQAVRDLGHEERFSRPRFSRDGNQVSILESHVNILAVRIYRSAQIP
jgi:hypothetical protein